MTRKDYETLARVILGERAFIAGEYDLPEAMRQWEVTARVAVRMAEVLAHTNPRFDRDRFLTACGLCDTEINKAEGTLTAHRERVKDTLKA